MPSTGVVRVVLLRGLLGVVVLPVILLLLRCSVSVLIRVLLPVVKPLLIFLRAAMMILPPMALMLLLLLCTLAVPAVAPVVEMVATFRRHV